MSILLHIAGKEFNLDTVMTNYALTGEISAVDPDDNSKTIDLTESIEDFREKLLSINLISRQSILGVR